MNKIYLPLLCTLGLGFLLTACQSKEELIDDLEYARVLTPLKFDAEVVPSTGTDVILSWQKIKNADGYELEIYEQTDDSKEVSTANTGTLVGSTYILGADEVPYTVYGLEVDKAFYARVRGTSTALPASNWAYLEKTFSTSAVRNSLNPKVTDRTASSVTLAWDDADDKEDLTSVRVELVVPGEEDSERKVTLSDEQIAQGSVRIDELDPAREYRFTLLFGKAGNRGSVTAFTRPVLDGVNSVYSGAEIISAIEGQSAEVKLLVAAADVDVTSAYAEGAAKTINVTSDVYLYGQSSAEGIKPVIKGLNFNLKAGAKVLHIEDVNVDGDKLGAFVSNESADMERVEYINSEISGFTKAIYSVAGSASEANVASFLVEDSYVHDINAQGTEGGDFIDVRNGKNGDFVVRNSTFYACARTFFRLSDSAKAKRVLAENCTFNLVTATNSSSNNAGIFAVRIVTETQSVKAINNVFLNERSDGEGDNPFVRLSRNSTDSFRPECSGNLYYNVGDAWFVSNAVPAELDNASDASFEEIALVEGKILDNDPCVNSIAGKLYLAGTAGNEIKARKAGDPRWWDAVQPVIIRETELSVVEDEFTWDFTEKTIYDTEELLENTIIGNARIYATATVPAQVVMGKGIDFTAGASVSPEGIPTYSAVEILTAGYGSVKLTATGESGIESVQVLVGSDRYAVLADGKEHSVVLGDLSGENSIYVIANQALTLQKITWSKDLTEDPDRIVLATPKVSVTPAKLDQGTAEPVVISWGAVENAADYVLTFNKVESILTETSYTIPADEVAGLAVNEYPISVVARPVSTSTKYAASEAGEATLKINKVVVGGEVSMTWDFSSPEWQAEFAKYGASNTDITHWDLTYDGLSIYSAAKSKYNTTFFQWGGKGSASDRYAKFTAPAAGTLTVWASNTGSSEDLSRMVTVNQNGVETSLPGGVPSNGDPAALEFDVEAGEVLIYATGNALRFYKLEFTYIGGAAPAVEYDWDFASAEWQAEFAKYGASNTDITNWDLTYDGLNIYSAAKSKYNTTFFQWGGKGSTSDRYAKFTAPGAGTLTVWASNTGSSEDLNRMVTVNQNGVETSLPGGVASNGDPAVLEFDVEAGEVLIYATGNALRFYHIHFSGQGGGAATTKVDKVWDFGSAEWQAEFAKYGASNTDITNWDLTYDDLTLYSAAKSKYNTTFFQWGGKGSTSDRYLKYEAPTGGTLSVKASNTGSSEDLNRMVTVNQNGVETSLPGGVASNGDPAVLEFDVEAGEVLIYATGNALRFYAVAFHSN